MPTLKPRVQVTLEPETHAVIERLAYLQGCSRGAIIGELLEAVTPSLTQTVALLEAAASAPQQVKDGLKSVVEGIHEDLQEFAGDSSKQLDMLLNQLQSGGSDSGASPHVVTRGSGINPPAVVTGPKKTRKPSKPRGSANG